MIRAADLPDTLPVFPLPGAVLLPRARLPLHIFEPRYLAMIEDCLKSDRRLIGMIQPRGEGGGLAAVGCAGRLTSFSETEDGRYMITLSGQARFTVLEEIAGFVPYRRARVDWTQFPGDLGPAEADKDFDRAAFLQRLGRYLRMAKMGTDWSSLKEADDEMLVNALCMLCPFAVEEKQALLEARSLPDRRRVLETLIDRRMLEALICPQTQGALRYDVERQELISDAAHLAFPIRDGIPIMLVSEARAV